MSRLPVREALQRLAFDGLVEQIPRRGSFIAQLNADKAANVLDIIGALLALAARSAASTATASDLARMRSQLEAVKDAMQTTAATAYPHEMYDFHADLVTLSGNPVLKNSLEPLDNQVQLIRRHRPSHSSALVAMSAWKEHAAILEAIEQRDAQLAAERSVQHLERVKQRLLSSLSASHRT